MSSGSGRGAQSGVTYLSALLLVAALGAALAATAQVWSQARQREREAELLWIGERFRQAIARYYHLSPAGAGRFPQKLEDLVQDPRSPAVRRHLRRIYADPMTGREEWGLVTGPEGGIVGVHSLSDRKPIRSLDGAASYSQWRFVFEPPAAVKRP